MSLERVQRIRRAGAYLRPVVMLACVLGCAAARAAGTNNWDQCIRRISQSDLMAAEQKGGRLGANEFRIERCGFRPVIVGRNGIKKLRAEDCTILHGWAKHGDCHAQDFAQYQKAFVQELDPEVVRIESYARACMAFASPADREAFAELACRSAPPERSERK